MENEINNSENKQLTFKSTIESYNDKDHTIVFVISNGSVDHDHEIVNPKGMFFRKQPKGLYNHNYNIPAVTKLQWVKYDSGTDSLKAKFEFDQNDPFSVLLENKYANGFMTDVSIGFITDVDSIEFNAMGILIHNRWELLEVSLVNIGSNLDAVSLTMDECNSLMKSKAYTSSVEMKGYVEELREKVLARDIEKSVTAKFEEIINGLKTEIANLTIDVPSNLTQKEIEELIITHVDKKFDGFQKKLNTFANEINKLKLFKQSLDIKTIMGT